MIGFFRSDNGYTSGSDRNQIHADAERKYIATEGIIENTFETVYNDMALINDGYPTGKPSSFGQFWSGVTGRLVVQVEGWTRTNFWFEFDMQQLEPISCAVGMMDYPHNSCIEVSNGVCYWLDDNGAPSDPLSWTWRNVIQTFPHLTSGPINYSGINCPDTAPFVAARATMPSDFNTSTIDPAHINVRRLPNNNLCINPINGFRYHGWLEGNGPTDRLRIQAVYGCMYFRLVLIDPNGPDDRHLYNQIVHVASDIRDDSGTFPPGYEYWGVGGLSRYKKVPNNGDWIRMNFVCFREDSAYGDRDSQTTLQRIIDTRVPFLSAPNYSLQPSIISNTIDEIWDDMHEPNTGQPCASSMSYEYVAGPIFKERITGNPYDPDWKRINCWFEIEEGCGIGYQECQPTQNLTTNTRVEITPMWLMWQDLTGGQYGDGDWHILHDGTGTIDGTKFPGEHGGEYPVGRGCTNPEYDAIRTAHSTYNPAGGTTSGNYLYNPKYYWWYHGWSTQVAIDPYIINAIYGCAFVRLVLIDPNGPDDRHLSNFVVHLSSDKKSETGGIVGPGLDTGGISRYKRIPTNGDWMPVNWITGWITKESLTASPPPFPTTPAG